MIELMVVVTILVVLSLVAVVSYKKYIRRGKNMEAIYMLGDIGMKQATYFGMYGQYVDTRSGPSAFGDGDYYPAGSIANGDKPWSILCPDHQSSYPGWCALGSRPSSATVNYQYVTVGWAPGDPSPPTIYIKNPERHWWYAVARGDLDGNGVHSRFIMSSEVSEVYYYNEIE